MPKSLQTPQDNIDEDVPTTLPIVNTDELLLETMIDLAEDKGNTRLKRRLLIRVARSLDPGIPARQGSSVRVRQDKQMERIRKVVEGALAQDEKLARPLQVIYEQVKTSDEASNKVVSAIESGKVDQDGRRRIQRVLQYAGAKEAFIENNTMMSMADAGRMLGLAVSNLTRLKKHLKEKGVLMLHHEGQTLVPAFQFSQQPAVFNAIKPLIAAAMKRDLDVLDVCEFLVTPRDVDIREGDFSDDIDIDAIADEIDAKGMIFNGAPIDALHQRDSDVFNVLVDAWLHPDTYQRLPA